MSDDILDLARKVIAMEHDLNTPGAAPPTPAWDRQVKLAQAVIDAALLAVDEMPRGTKITWDKQGRRLVNGVVADETPIPTTGGLPITAIARSYVVNNGWDERRAIPIIRSLLDYIAQLRGEGGPR